MNVVTDSLSKSWYKYYTQIMVVTILKVFIVEEIESSHFINASISEIDLKEIMLVWSLNNIFRSICFTLQCFIILHSLYLRGMDAMKTIRFCYEAEKWEFHVKMLDFEIKKNRYWMRIWIQDIPILFYIFLSHIINRYELPLHFWSCSTIFYKTNNIQ